MSAYVVIHGTVKNPEKMQEYSTAAGVVIEKFGGEFLVRGPAQVLSGEHSHKMMVVVRFPDAETAKKWYNSTEYQKLISIRDEGIDSSFILCGE